MIYQGDCVDIMNKLIQDGIKVGAVIADLPYFQVVEDEWDNQWKSVEDYLTCKNLNREFIGIEKDEKYFKIAKERINPTHKKGLLA